MEESSRTVQEIAKTTGQAIKTVDRLGQFFSRVMSESIDATCGMLADTLKYKKWERQIKLLEKAELLIEQKQLSGKTVPIPPKLAIPIFQQASIEDNEFLHSIYAKLLVSAIDPDVQTRRTAYVEIIRQLEPIDVQFLQKMYASYISQVREWCNRPWYKKFYSDKGKEVPPTHVSIYKHTVIGDIDVTEFNYWASIDNLIRLGLANSYIQEGSVDLETSDGFQSSDVVTSHGGYEQVCITPLGVSFVKICNY